MLVEPQMSGLGIFREFCLDDTLGKELGRELEAAWFKQGLQYPGAELISARAAGPPGAGRDRVH